MGLGKTPCVATLTMKTLYSQRAINSCTLYICPKNLLGTVRHEFHKFFGDQVKVLIFHRDFQGPLNSFQTQFSDFDVIITSYATAVNNIQSLENFRWFRIILDESHSIRNRSTKRFKAINRLQSDRRICLTGTPIHNSLKDMFNQLEFCGYIKPPKLKPTKKNLKEQGLMQMIRFVEYKDAKTVTLPTKNVYTRLYTLNDRERFLHELYAHETKELYKQLMDAAGRDKSAIALNVEKNIRKVIQVCSSPFLLCAESKSLKPIVPERLDAQVCNPDPEVDAFIKNRAVSGLQSSKMLAFRELIQEISGKTVVFANQTATLYLARETSKDLCKSVFIHGSLQSKKREELFSDFRINPDVSVLFMTLQLGSVGLNLTEATNVIFLEPYWSYAALHQGECRVHRIGQTQVVDIYYLIGKDTMELSVFACAEKKRKLVREIVDEQDYDLSQEDKEMIVFMRDNASK